MAAGLPALTIPLAGQVPTKVAWRRSRAFFRRAGTLLAGLPRALGASLKWSHGTRNRSGRPAQELWLGAGGARCGLHCRVRRDRCTPRAQRSGQDDNAGDPGGLSRPRRRLRRGARPRSRRSVQWYPVARADRARAAGPRGRTVPDGSETIARAAATTRRRGPRPRSSTWLAWPARNGARSGCCRAVRSGDSTWLLG